jgi:carbonic anhydrase
MTVQVTPTGWTARCSRHGERRSPVTTDDPFGDVTAGNHDYAARYQTSDLPARAAKGLAVVTCMDSRIDPLPMLGLSRGDAKILRNAGARITDDMLRSLVAAAYLLDVNRVMLVAHTGCRMAGGNDNDIHLAIEAAGGPDTRDIAFLTVADQMEALRADVRRVQSCAYLPAMTVGGFLHDLRTGQVRRVC